MQEKQILKAISALEKRVVDLYHRVKAGVGSQGPQGVQGPLGPPGPVGPAGLEWQGAWVSGTSYVEDDAVGYDGASWFCILATSGTTAPDVDTTHWALLASQGAVGPAGAQGPTGSQGIPGATGATGAQGPSGSASAQTNGIMYLTPSDSPYQTLSYDINRINLSSGSSAVCLPAAAPIGKEISVFLEDSTNSVNMFGDNVLNLSFPFLMGSANQQTGTSIIFGGESYVFISLGSGLWKVNAISKTIMTGSAASSSTTRTVINATNVSVLDRTTLSGNTLFKDALRFIRDNGSGVNRRIDLKCPTNITSDKTITFPDASGTVALTSDFTKTRGTISGGPFGSEVVLPYDINITNGSAFSGNLFKLPNNAILGKEIIVDCMAGIGIVVYPFSGGGFETAVNGQSGQYNIPFNGLVKFTSYANNYWLVETLQRNAPLLEGKDLSIPGGYYLATQSFTTAALSLSSLNSNYPETYAMNGFQLFCPNIVGGGLVYTKINVGTWVSNPITMVS